MSDKEAEVAMFCFDRARVSDWLGMPLPKSGSTVERDYIRNYLMNVILYDDENRRLISDRIGVPLDDIEACCTEFPVADGRPDLLVRTARHLVVVELKDEWQARFLDKEGKPQVRNYASRAKGLTWAKGRTIVPVLAWSSPSEKERRERMDDKYALF